MRGRGGGEEGGEREGKKWSVGREKWRENGKGREERVRREGEKGRGGRGGEGGLRGGRVKWGEIGGGGGG